MPCNDYREDDTASTRRTAEIVENRRVFGIGLQTVDLYERMLCEIGVLMVPSRDVMDPERVPIMWENLPPYIRLAIMRHWDRDREEEEKREARKATRLKKLKRDQAKIKTLQQSTLASARNKLVEMLRSTSGQRLIAGMTPEEIVNIESQDYEDDGPTDEE